MSVAVIADAHLGGPGGDPGPLLEQLEELPQKGCRRLLLLGDMFQVWVAGRRWETEDIRRVAGVLKRLREKGLAIDYVEGNRDFFLEGSRYAALFDRLDTEIAFEHGGVRYLAVHGDGLNDRDRQYLFWRWISKSRLTRLLAMNLPAALAHYAMDSGEKRLSATNFKHKQRLPEEAIVRFGERRLAEGHDVVLLGHFHEPRTWDVAGGQIRLFDAWFNSRRVEWLGE